MAKKLKKCHLVILTTTQHCTINLTEKDLTQQVNL